MAYIPVEMAWFGSFCQGCILIHGAQMHRHGGLLTQTGREKKPGLVFAFREARTFWVEEDTFNDFVRLLTPWQIHHIEGGNILLLT